MPNVFAFASARRCLLPLSAVGLLALLPVTVNAGLFAHSPLELSKETLQAHRTDLDGLAAAWFQPMMHGIHYDTDRQHILNDQDALAKGFEKFCRANAGRAYITEVQFGVDQQCVDSQGNATAWFTVRRWESGRDMWLTISYDTASKRQAIAEAQRLYTESRAKNGPTGWIETKEGRERVIRFGDLNQRLLLEVDAVPIEQVSHLQWNDCCHIEATLVGGETRVVNSARLSERVGPDNRTAGWQQLSVVLIDKNQHQPYVRVYAANEVKALSIDPPGTLEPLAVDGRISTSLTAIVRTIPDPPPPPAPVPRPVEKTADAVKETDAQGREIIHGPVYGSYYANVHIISSTVGIASSPVTVMNSVIEAPVCIRTSGMNARVIGNTLACGQCVEFTGSVLMGNLLQGNQCSGRGTNRPDVFNW